jgi:peptide/nickel transport system permease protein
MAEQTLTNPTANPTVAPIQLRSKAPESTMRKALRRFTRHRLAMAGVVIIILMVIASLFGSEEAALETDLKVMNEPPSAEHLLGTDRVGRDILARTLVGGRISLSVGLVAVLFSTTIGTVTGALAGYYRGWLDHFIMRIVDVVLSFPVIVLLLVVASLVGPSIFNMMVMIGLLTWPIPCRIMRGQFLSVRERAFVEAARCLGVSNFQIATRHILPNAVAPLLVYASFGVATAVLLEAGLSYLNLGVQQPTPSWGNMLNTARTLSIMEGSPWMWVPPAIATVLFVLAVNFVGDGIRDALDPTAIEK